MNNPKILVVDDSFQNIALIQSIFEEEPWDVEYVYTGIIAIERIKQQPYDLIILDIRMPDISGLDVCRILKEAPKLKTTPVLFMTAYSDKDTLNKAFEAGAIDYIKKPFINEEFIARVNAHLAIKLAHNDLEIEIKKRIQAEEQLQVRLTKHKSLLDHYNKLAENFKTIFNSSSEMMFITDFKGTILEVNQTAIDNLEYSHTEFMRQNITDIEIPDFKSNFPLIINEKVEENSKYELDVLARTGNIFQVEVYSKVFNYFDKKAILTVMHDVTEKNRLKKELVTSIIQTQDKERKAYAVKIHDDLAPVLTTIQLFAGLIAKKTDDDKLIDVGHNIMNLTKQAIDIAKSIANNIFPHLLENIGLYAAIKAYCEQINRAEKIFINFEQFAKNIVLPKNMETLVYYSIKELINNTILHANASDITISATFDNKHLMINYFDNGKGIVIQDSEQKLETGMGFKNISQRIETVNGEFVINTNVESGFHATISIPINFNNE